MHCTPFHPPISCPCSTNHIKPPFISALNPFSSSFYPLPNNNIHSCPSHPMPSSFKLGCGYFPSDSYNCRHHHQHGIIININKKSQHDPNIVLILPIPISHLQLWRIVKTCRPCMNPPCMRRKKTENQVFTRPTIKSRLMRMCSSCADHVRRVQVYRETCESVLTATFLYCCNKN